MNIERAANGTNLVEVLDRVLDKGIVIDAWVRVSLVGIDLVTVEARVVVASLATYLQYADDIAQAGMGASSVNGARAPAVEPAGRLRHASLAATLS